MNIDNLVTNHNDELSNNKNLKVYGVILALLLLSVSSARADVNDIDVNDITILFPLPKEMADLDKLITIESLENLQGVSVLPANDLTNILSVAETVAVRNRRIKLKPIIKEVDAWKIAGIRFDPSAPGGSQNMISSFGSMPQIRLVIQPVTFDGALEVHDVAVHIIYDYVEERIAGEAGTISKGVPDSQKTKDIVEGLLALKSVCEEAGIDTNVPLNVHPCLGSDVAGFSNEVEEFLRKHLDHKRFNTGAVMALHNGGPEPWLFFSIQRDADSGQFTPIPSPGLAPFTDPEPKITQMVSFIDSPKVQPVPSTTNLLPINSSVVIPVSQRRGVSTAPLFTNSIPLTSPAEIGIDGSGRAVFDDEIKNGDVADIIANPTLSHFFNTDCVSCHTETTRRFIREIPESSFAFKVPELSLIHI